MCVQPQALRSEPGLNVYRRSTAVVSRQISGETLVVPIRGKVGDLASIYSFNETGSVLWAALVHPKSLEDLTSLLCQSFEVGWDDARWDADAFVREMRAAMNTQSYGAFSQSLHQRYFGERAPLEVSIEVTRRCPLGANIVTTTFPWGTLVPATAN